MGDREAIKQVELWSLINNLPGLFCAIGDCAYPPTAHLIPIFGGAQAKVKKHDDFNYFASQCRIRIEMAFGLMVKKWGILNKPLSLKLRHAKHLIVCIARLHNYCINERILRHGFVGFEGSEQDFSPYEEAMRATAATHEFEEAEELFDNPWSQNRDRMVDIISSKNMSRPKKATNKTK
jgi:DDE superfamily endonuclease